MSDSDDTDALLLIPPDLFCIHSDSEDLFCDVWKVQNSELERVVVNDLIDQVKELESRVNVIEHDAFNNLDSQCLSGCSRRPCGSFENVRNYYTPRHSSVNAAATPIKIRLPLSLPSTPSGYCHTFQPQSLECSICPDTLVKQDLSKNFKTSSKVTTVTMQPAKQDDYSFSHQLETIGSQTKEAAFPCSIQMSTTPLDPNQKQDLMCEIDEFLNSVKKKQAEVVQEDSLGISGNVFHEWQKNYHTLRFPSCALSQMVPSVKQCLNTEMRGLALSDVGRLLDEFESTQAEIMHKLHGINKPFPEKSTSLLTSLTASESANNTLLNLSLSTSAEKVNKSKLTSNDFKTSCQLTEGSLSLTNDESSLNRPGVKSAKRKLDFSCEFPSSKDLGTKMAEVNGTVNVEPLVSSSNTTCASSLSSAASTIQALPAVGNAPLADGQGSSRDLAQRALHLANYRPFLQSDQGVGLSSGNGSAFSTHTYPPFTSGRLSSSVLTPSVLHAQSLEPGAGLGRQPTVPPRVPNEAKCRQQGEANRGLMVLPVTNAAAGDFNSAEPQTCSFENDPVMATRAARKSGNLLSLSELWIGEEAPGQHKDDAVNPIQKLEEERYRRKHCEQQIRQLQSRLLEEQQKVAVAVEVDRAKDRAILQLQEGWRQLVDHWRELEEQRNSVTNTLHLERQAFQRDMGQVSQRTKHLEKELSRMLDLAQDYREKSEAAGRESEESKRKHQVELQEAIARVQQLEQALSFSSEALKNAHAKEDDLLGQLHLAQQEVLKEKQAQEAVDGELEQLRKRLEPELLAMKEVKESLQMKLKEEKNRNSLLDKQKKALQVAMDDLKKKEKVGREEARMAAERLERAKLELRDHYQQQVEKVVQEKMHEFQAQLDADEVSMRSELQQRERAVTELAAQQIKQIADKHEVEIRLVEEKHQEEQQLLRVQLSQSTQKVADLVSAVTQLRSHRGQVAEHLHTIMEAQWRESVRILAGGSPLHQHKPGASGDAWEVPSLPLQNLEQWGSSSISDSVPFGQDGQLTYRVKTNQSQQPTSQTDRGDELKKYIAMLLDCKPGDPAGVLSEIPTSECGRVPARTQQEYLRVKLGPEGSHYHVQDLVSEADLVQLATVGSSREGQAGKPPWK